MKRFFLLFICSIAILATQAQVAFDALTFYSQYPQVLQRLTFSFDKKLSPLKDGNNIEIVVYEFTNKGLIVKEPILKKIGTVYSSSIVIDSNATALAFGITAGEEKDNNGSKGYIVPIYDGSKQPVKGYYARAGQLYAGYGEFLFGMAKSSQINLNLLEQGMNK